jgi:hypothetical protein
MRVLMSLCNVGLFNSQFSLASVDVERGHAIDLIDCQHFMDPARDSGVTGLIRLSNGGMAMCIQSPDPRIVFLHPDWTAHKVVRDPRFADLHSLLEHEGFVFVTCTGVNKVVKISLDDFAVSLFWEYPVDEPFLHINSMIFHGERPLVCSHKVPPESKGGGASGGCWYLDDYEVLMSGLKQPHTVTLDEGAIHCLSSHDFRVVTWRGGELSSGAVQGYLRGLLVADGRMVVGSSSQRFVSRKKKELEKYVDFAGVVGNPLFMSSLVVADAAFKPARRVNTTILGFEIYDVIADPGAPDRLRVRPAPAVRMQTMQRQLVHMREVFHARGRGQ